MVVSDTCGISRSFSVAVIDTSSPDCITQSHFSLSDSVICRGAIVALQNQSIAATHYKWTVNGITYAYTTDTTYTTNVPGIYAITLYAYIGTCVDSATADLLVEDTLHNSGVKDTFLCAPFSLSLNTHNANSVWSTSVDDSVVSISTEGTYWVQVTNSCGTARDSFHISSRQSPLFNLNAPIGYICDDQPDSTLLIATLTDSTGAPVMFIWSTGQTDTSAHSSQIIVYQAGSYAVTVSDGFCPLSMDTSIVSSSCDSICFAHIAVPDAFSPNGDGMNDTFHLLHFCEFKPFAMHVYNRWGELVFVSDDIDKGWDGTYKGKQQEEGVYWVWFSLSIEGKKAHYISGRVNLFR
jgi:gliding motility-associated-like protein